MRSALFSADFILSIIHETNVSDPVKTVVPAFRYNRLNQKGVLIDIKDDQIEAIEETVADLAAAEEMQELGITDTNGVGRSTAIMSAATLLSRATGFARMWATALALGAGAAASAYNIANNVPNMIFELVAGGILASLFIPTFTEVRDEQGEAAAWRFASQIFNIMALLLGAIAVVGALLPEPFIWTQTFRMDPEKASSVRDTAEFFFRFFSIQVVIYGVGMVIQAVLNAQRKYLWPALGPVFNNLIVIATLIFVATQPLTTKTLAILAIGTSLGVVGMFAVMVPSLAKSNFKYSFSLGLNNPAIHQMLKLGIPTFLYVITNLISVSFRNASALSVGEYGPSVLMYAWTWYQLPYGIIAVALATALFTELSIYASKKDMSSFKRAFSMGLRTTSIMIIPSSVLLYVLATPLTTLFLAGRFEESDIPLVAGVLKSWAFALTFYACMMFVLRAFYSLKDTLTPALANIGTSIVQVIGYLVLTTGLGAWTGLGLSGIPIADLIFCFLQFGILLFLMRRKIGSFDIKSFISVFVRMTCASILAGIVVHYLVAYLSPSFVGVGGSIVLLLIGAVVGFSLSFCIARLFNIKEAVFAGNLIIKFVNRFRKKKTA